MLKKRPRTRLLTFVFACTAACASSRRPQLMGPEIEEARVALMTADRAWAEAAASDDIERILTFWTHDAVIGRQKGPPPIVGIDAIRAFITRARRNDPGFSITWQPAQAWVSADGTTGCTFGIGTRTFTAKSGAIVTESAPYTCVWRSEYGRWKCALDLRNP